MMTKELLCEIVRVCDEIHDLSAMLDGASESSVAKDVQRVRDALWDVTHKAFAYIAEKDARAMLAARTDLPACIAEISRLNGVVDSLITSTIDRNICKSFIRERDIALEQAERLRDALKNISSVALDTSQHTFLKLAHAALNPEGGEDNE